MSTNPDLASRALSGLPAAALFLAGVADAQSGAPPGPMDNYTAQTTGAVETVYDYSVEQCDALALPDGPARAIRDASGDVHVYLPNSGIVCSQGMFLGGNYRMSGPDFDNLQIDCTPVMSSSDDPVHSNFNSHEWLNGLWTADGTTVFGLVHVEYDANCYGGCPAAPDFCDPRTVTHAFSTDGGASFNQAIAPRHAVAIDPYTFPNPHIGIGEPSNILFNAADGFFYAMTNLGTEYQGAPWGPTTVMRTDNIRDPSSWLGWGGDPAFGGSGTFDVDYLNPYLAPPGFNPDDHVPFPISVNEIGLMHEAITYNTYLEAFVLIGLTAPVGADALGIYYSFSQDLVHWTQAKLLDPILQWPTATGPGQYRMFYPGMIDHQSPSMAFDQSGKTAHVYFTDWNDQPPFPQGIDRDLLRVPIEFFKP